MTPPDSPAAVEWAAATDHEGGSQRPTEASSRLDGRRRTSRWNSENLFIPIALVLLIGTLALTADRFLSHANLINILTQMSILAVVAFGVTVVMIGGNFDLSVGAQVALHGSFSAMVMVWTGSIILGLLAGVGAGLLFGLFNGLLVAGLNINPFIATLGTLVAGKGLALAITGTRPVTGLPASISGFGADRPLGVPWMVWVMVGAFVVAFYILHVNPFGLKVFATGGNREAARLAGIRTARVVIASFMISGAFAAVAGMAISARLRSGQPLAGSLLELFAVAAVVLGGSSLYGGRGSVTRTLMGVALIAIIANGLNLLGLSTPVQEIIIGLVFIAAASAEFFRARRGRS